MLKCPYRANSHLNSYSNILFMYYKLKPFLQFYNRMWINYKQNIREKNEIN